MNSMINKLITQAQLVAPSGEGLSDALIQDRDGNTAVASLFGARAPFAVIRRVALRIIFAFDGVLVGRALAHISKEVGKIIPAIADGNTTFSVFSIASVLRVVAASTHPLPNDIFRQLPGRIRFAVSVFRVSFNQRSLLPTSAAFLVTPFEISRRGVGNTAADTLTKPEILGIARRSVANKVQHGQVVKNLSRQITKLGSFRKGLLNGDNIGNSHFASLQDRFKNSVRAASVLQSQVRPVSILAYLSLERRYV